MELVLLLALGVLANIWVGSDDDQASDVAPERPDADENQRLRGTQGADDLLQGGAGDDTLGGNDADADRLIGGPGDDRLVMGSNNTAAGGAGADVFVARSPGGTIADFTPGEDQLRFERGDSGNAFEPVHDWREEEDGFSLQRIDASGQSTQIALLAGLDAPPPATDLLQVERSAETGEITGRTGDEDLLFHQRITGTEGHDTVEIDNPGAIVRADLGAGDDSASVVAQRAAFDLGDGDDSYVSHSDNFDLRGENGTRTGSFEHVRGGAGNDTIIAGVGEMRAEGGPGNDLIDFTDGRFGTAIGNSGNDVILGMVMEGDVYGWGDHAIRLAGHGGDDTISGAWLGAGGSTVSEDIDGGPGDDLVEFSLLDRVTGGSGADSLALHWNGDDRLAFDILPHITDFDPDEDVLMIVAPPGYAGAGDIGIAPRAGGGSDILLDGARVGYSEVVLRDTSAISLAL